MKHCISSRLALVEKLPQEAIVQKYGYHTLLHIIMESQVPQLPLNSIILDEAPILTTNLWRLKVVLLTCARMAPLWIVITMAAPFHRVRQVWPPEWSCHIKQRRWSFILSSCEANSDPILSSHIKQSWWSYTQSSSVAVMEKRGANMWSKNGRSLHPFKVEDRNSKMHAVLSSWKLWRLIQVG